MKKQRQKNYGIDVQLWGLTVYDLKKGRRILHVELFEKKGAGKKLIKRIGRKRYVGPIFHKINIKL